MGCSQTRVGYQKTLVERVPRGERNDNQRLDRAGREPTGPTVPGDAGVRPVALKLQERSRSGVDPPAPEPLPGSSLATPKPPEPSTPVAPAGDDVDQAGKPLPLQEAIGLAFRRQPRLRAHLESIEQARGLKGIAHSLFLPTLGTSYSVGGFNLNSGGIPVRLATPGGQIPGFNVLPPGLALPIGINLSTGYELAELKLQWLVIDFGKRLGTYEAAKLGVDIAQLQTDRAYQTVSSEVAVAYYNVLRTRALRRTAREAVRRSEDQRDVARKLAAGGVVEREQVLRAEVQLAESLRLLDNAEEAVGVADAALNLAIGLKPGEAVGVVEPPGVPEFRPDLRDCLETAIRRRREFQVARRSVEVAQQGDRVATASFAPRIVAEGTLLDLQQSAPRGHVDFALGFIRMEWTMFEGGRRVAARRVADSKVREAMAQAESIADTIAFQVNENYRKMVTARLGIERARPAVEQARENYRLVRARAAEGDATPSEITDAQTALTRAEQNDLNSVYDYLSAIARLEFVMGVSPSPLDEAH
jgi:outer membrane protein TolC